MNDSLLFDAGSLFFALWIAIVATVSITAFGRDLLPRSTHLDPAKRSQPANPNCPTQSSTLD
jgi:hypothetical protein